ncbi:non-homologous end joining protein Ku [Capillimicrobium parvum]|uniref:Non-homologous end joining protein Ku n=1 Tax=Capillimicrobium parvum TaxID=2884022 RepID=A0A9E7C1W8_9ACTN|nr:Ku protein [Capillimicrobium parvum]UGS37831.1 Non-homologous end joining protein Ku [Capillimicrobium parvum]
MPRAIWTGAISFGLVTVPVRLYSAVNRKTVSFNQLDSSDNGRIAQKRINPRTGEEVPYERIVKGFAVAPDSYVVITNEELDALEPEKTRTIDIEDFVDQSEIDPIFYDHPYYLAPGPGGAKPYRLLLDAMRETNKVAIARVVIRSKESLVAIRPAGDVLEMSTMLFADEVADPTRIDELPDPDDVKTTDKELSIAKQLVDSLAGPFEPGKYKDEYREQVLALIERKAAGEEIAVQEAPEAAPTEVPDLMSALQASLDAVRGADKKDAPKRKSPAASRQKSAAKG